MSIIQCPRCDSRYDASLQKAGDELHCKCGQRFYIPKLPNLAKAWNCPNCGGGITAQKNHCDYCGVSISFARCPSCFGIAPYRGAKFCSECGSSLQQAAQALDTKPSTRSCPRCNKPLFPKEAADCHFEACDACGGLWVDHVVVEKIVAKAQERKSLNALLGKSPLRSSQLTRHKVRYLACPVCKALMFRRNFAQKSGVIVDECTAHGIWFDHHELAAILEYSRSNLSPVETKSFKEDNKQEQRATKPLSNNHFNIATEDLKQLIEHFPFLSKK